MYKVSKQTFYNGEKFILTAQWRLDKDELIRISKFAVKKRIKNINILACFVYLDITPLLINYLEKKYSLKINIKET